MEKCNVARDILNIGYQWVHKHLRNVLFVIFMDSVVNDILLYKLWCYHKLVIYTYFIILLFIVFYTDFSGYSFFFIVKKIH